jgi:acetyl esterase
VLHPQTRAFLDLVEKRGLPPMHTLNVAEARAFYRDRRGYTQPQPPDVAEVRPLEAKGPHGSIPMRLFRAAGTASTEVLPALIYFHGGGWTIGDLDTHDTLCRELCNQARCAVVSVDYRMGPEHRFPAAVDDCIAATRWLRDHATGLKIDAARLAVGGDSAGGNLATVVCIDARDHEGPGIVFQLLIYPATDQHRTALSHAQNGSGYFLTTELMDYFVDNYINDKTYYSDWRASPLLHPNLVNLPAALIITAGFDPLRDEGAAYAKRLTDAGNHVCYVNFPRQIHGFVLMGRILDESHTAVALCASELRRAFNQTTPQP